MKWKLGGERAHVRTVRCFAVRLHSMRLSSCEVKAALDWFDVDHCQTIWYREETLETQSDPPTAESWELQPVRNGLGEILKSDFTLLLTQSQRWC